MSATARHPRPPRAPRTYEFTLILSGATEPSDEIQGALLDAGCDDALLGSRGGVLFLDFDREAPTMAHAVLTAIEDVERSRANLKVVRVEPDELVTVADIASRLGRSRESVRLLATGRRGKGDFPPPVARVAGRSPLYRWSDVASWFAGREADDTETGEVKAAIDAGVLIGLTNAILESRRLIPHLPEAEVGHLFRALGLTPPKASAGSGTGQA